jgi:hypothetical protein
LPGLVPVPDADNGDVVRWRLPAINMKKVLKLRRQVVRNLDDRQMGGVNGGIPTGTTISLPLKACLPSVTCPQTTAISCGGGCPPPN